LLICPPGAIDKIWLTRLIICHGSSRQ
jgi:hypothetical protein